MHVGGGKSGALRIGFGKVGVIDSKFQRTILEIQGKLKIDDSEISSINRGSRISVCKDAELSIGKGFHNSAAITIICEEKISIGNNVTTSWDSLIMDTDFHDTINTETKEQSKHTRPIVIGDNVWTGCRSVILKGSVIADGCIVGANALVSGKFLTPNIAIGGNPAKCLKNNITKA